MPEPLNITVQDAMAAFERATLETGQLKLINMVLEKRVQSLEAELLTLKESINGRKEAGTGV